MHRLVYVGYLLMVASGGVTFAFFEEFETDYGLPAWGIGLISSLTFITTLIAALIIAPYGDRGHLTLLGAISFITAILGNLWIGYADELWSLSVSRGLAGIGTGLFSVVGRKALIGDNTDDTGEKIGGFISAAVAGFIGGPALGAQLSQWGGIATPYVFIAVLLAVVALPTLRWLSAVPIATTAGARISAMLPLLRTPGVRAAVAAQVALFFNIGVFNSTVDEYLTGLGVSNSQLGLILIVIASPLLVIPRLAGRVIDRQQSPARTMLTGLAVFVPIVLLLGLWQGVAVFITLAFLQTFAESVVFPAVARVVITEAGAEKSAIGTGLIDAAGSSAAALSAFISPVVFDVADGPIGSFGMSGAVGATLLAIALTTLRRASEKQDVAPGCPDATSY